MLVLDKFVMKYEGGTELKKPRLRFRIMVYYCKTELNISAFKVFNKRIIVISKECMVLVCYL